MGDNQRGSEEAERYGRGCTIFNIDVAFNHGCKVCCDHHYESNMYATKMVEDEPSETCVALGEDELTGVRIGRCPRK